MRCKVPDDVHVLLVQTEVETRAVDVADLAELAAVGDLAQLPDRGVVLERVTDHEVHVGEHGRVDQLFAFCDARRQRLFDQHVAVGADRGVRDHGVRARRRRDDDGVGLLEDVVERLGGA